MARIFDFNSLVSFITCRTFFVFVDSVSLIGFSLYVLAILIDAGY